MRRIVFSSVLACFLLGSVAFAAPPVHTKKMAKPAKVTTGLSRTATTTSAPMAKPVAKATTSKGTKTTSVKKAVPISSHRKAMQHHKVRHRIHRAGHHKMVTKRTVRATKAVKPAAKKPTP